MLIELLDLEAQADADFISALVIHLPGTWVLSKWQLSEATPVF